MRPLLRLPLWLPGLWFLALLLLALLGHLAVFRLGAVLRLLLRACLRFRLTLLRSRPIFRLRAVLRLLLRTGFRLRLTLLRNRPVFRLRAILRLLPALRLAIALIAAAVGLIVVVCSARRPVRLPTVVEPVALCGAIFLIQRSAGYDFVRPAMIDVVIRAAVLPGGFDVLSLEVGALVMLLAHVVAFPTIRIVPDSARSAAESDVAVAVYVVAIPVVIIVGAANPIPINVPDCGVVFEEPAVPAATEKADPKVSKSIIDAAIIADVAAPVAWMPIIHAVVPSPVSGGPKSTDKGRGDPGSGYPEVAVRTISPIAGDPDQAGIRARGLVIDEQRRRREPDADHHFRARCGWDQGCRQNKKQEPAKWTERFHNYLLAKYLFAGERSVAFPCVCPFEHEVGG